MARFSHRPTPQHKPTDRRQRTFPHRRIPKATPLSSQLSGSQICCRRFYVKKSRGWKPFVPASHTVPRHTQTRRSATDRLPAQEKSKATPEPHIFRALGNSSALSRQRKVCEGEMKKSLWNLPLPCSQHLTSAWRDLALCPSACPWLPLASPGFPWLPLASPGFPWLPLASPVFIWFPFWFPWLLLACPGFPLAELVSIVCPCFCE